MLGSSLIDNVLLTLNVPHMVYHVLQRFTKQPRDLSHFENRASSIIERSALARCNKLIIRKHFLDKEHHTTKRRQQDENTTRPRHEKAA